jgi:polygalacturonase
MGLVAAVSQNRLLRICALGYSLPGLPMKIPRLSPICCFALVLAIASGCSSTPPVKPATSVGAPTTPTHRHSVRDFGAKGDGIAKDTKAFQAALDLCKASGGGTVLVPNGVYLIGSIVIGPNTTLQLDRGASLIGSPDIADYPLVSVRWEGEFREGHRALISSENANNVAITGGSIFGPPLSVSRLRDPRGPTLIELANGTNVTLKGFSAMYQQLWTIHLLFCQNVTAQNLVIRSININSDGIDVDSCDGVTIEHCDINTGDDAIALKSGRGLAAMNLARPTQNVIIRDCALFSSIYAGLALGTEMSGGIRNVQIQNCTISGRQNGIFIKSRDGRGGYMENIAGDNLLVLNSGTFVGIDLTTKGIQATDPVTNGVAKWAQVKNVSFSNVRVSNIQTLVAGSNVPAERPIDGLTFSNMTGTCAKGITLANVTNVNLSHIEVTGYTGGIWNVTNNVSGMVHQHPSTPTIPGGISTSSSTNSFPRDGERGTF